MLFPSMINHPPQPILDTHLAIKAGYVRSLSKLAAKPPSISSVTPLKAGRGVEVVWDDGERSIFHSSWLRMNCSCGKCMQAASGQRTISLKYIPEHILLEALDISADSKEISIRWKDENHNSTFPLRWLKEHSYSDKDIAMQGLERKPLPYQGEGSPSMEYREMSDSDEGLLKYLRHLNEYGISVLTGVPKNVHVTQVARKFGPVLETIYGRDFQVISQPNPINIAYSDVNLPFHVDLAYYQSPPGLQLLHCVRFDKQVVGGESIFLDLFAVAEEFRKTNPQEFNTFLRVPATFQKIHFEREYPVYMKYQRPHIVLNHRDEIVAVTWSPAFEGPLFAREEDVEPYYEAYRKFDKAVNKSPLKLKLKLNEGDLVTFNNIRMLHGRKAFQLNDGVRQLDGCYVNIDEFRNKLDVLSQTVGDGRLSKRVGNGCFF
ncbi:gamma-butyrobetaine dioxygenase isoform X2 [Nematostella vectensis]|nr:gamma-butyrobetaine dioxygenase isoform X2 [Nematostella vectensis]